MKYKWIYLIVLLLLGIPFISNAKTCDADKVYINSISINNKSDNVIEIENTQTNKKEVNLNLNMKEKNDFIEYKIEIKNESNEDFYFDKNLIINHSKYIDYKLSSEDNSYIIKGKTSKIMTIKIYLKEDVVQSDYKDGIYTEDNLFVVNLSNDKIKNPLTGMNNHIILLIILIITIISTIIIMKKEKKKIITFLLFGTILISPLCINALCKAQFKINLKVTISTKTLSSFKIQCAGDKKFYFYEGMTFGDWIKSDLYPGNIDGDYESLEQCIQIWGNNRGCALVRSESVHSMLITEHHYTLLKEECEKHDTCEQINNQYYSLDYSFDGISTLEDCEYWYGEGTCQLRNSKYYYNGYSTNIYKTLEECEYHKNNNGNNEEAFCNLLSVAYQYNEDYYENYNTSEECEEQYNSQMEAYHSDPYFDNEIQQCIQRTVSHNSPTTKKINAHEQFSADKDLGLIYNNFEFAEFMKVGLNTEITNTTYNCRGFAECVSPESNILSDNKTIKAKDIKVNDSISYYDFKTNKIEIGKVKQVFIHKNAINFIKLKFEDDSYIEMTDYHPIYTSTGWKSYTNRNGYPKPKIGDLVKSNNGYKKIVEIKPFTGKEDFYDFKIISKDGKKVNNYFANGTLVQGSY